MGPTTLTVFCRCELRQRARRPGHPVERVAGVVLLVPANGESQRLRVQRIGEALADHKGREALHDARRPMHRPRDTHGGEHEQEVVSRLRDPFHAARLQCIHGLPEKPGDGEPDHLRDHEEDDEQHDVAAAALGMPPERRIEIS